MSDKDLLNRCQVILDFLYEVRELGHPTSQPKPKEKIMDDLLKQNGGLRNFTKFLEQLFKLNYVTDYDYGFLDDKNLQNLLNLYTTISRNIKIKEITKI